MRFVVLIVMAMAGLSPASAPAQLTEAISRAGTLFNVPPRGSGALSRAGTLFNVPPRETEAISRAGTLFNVPPRGTEALARAGTLFNVPPRGTEALARAGTLFNVPPRGTEAISRAGTVINFPWIPAVWTGTAGDSSYSNPGNWDIEAAPVNDDTTHYKVTVPADETVVYDLPAAAEITSLNLGTESLFLIAAAGSLSVLDPDSIAGTIVADDFAYLAVGGPSTLLPGMRMLLTGSATTMVDAATYVHGLIPSGPILSADGPGAVLRLSSLVSYEDSYDSGMGTRRSLVVRNGGRLDLPSLTTLIGAPINSADTLAVEADSLSSIDLDMLNSVRKRVLFDLSLARSDTLPSLDSATRTIFSLDANTTLHLPAAATFEYVTLSLSPASSLIAPSLTEYQGSRVSVSPTTFLITGILEDIDGSRFEATNGINYTQIADTSYVYNAYPSGPAGKIFHAKDSGTVLDLSSIRAYEDCYDSPGGDDVRSLTAAQGGHIDLSSLVSLAGALEGSGDALRIEAANGSIDLRSFNAGATKVVNYVVDGPSAEMTIGSLILNPDQRLSILNGGTLRVLSTMHHATADPDFFSAEAGIINFVGSGIGSLEVASADSGTSGYVAGGFGIGTLVVGSPLATTTLVLTDVLDHAVPLAASPNGGLTPSAMTAGGTTDALYLLGRNGEDGLQILNGSTMVIPANINVYVQIDSAMTRLNDLFQSGNAVPFGEGTLMEGIPTTSVGEDPLRTLAAFMRVFPNPFLTQASIRLGVPRPSDVGVAVYSVQGRQIREIVNEKTHPEGTFLYSWDGIDDSGRRVSAGVYFIRATIGKSTYSSQLILLR